MSSVIKLRNINGGNEIHGSPKNISDYPESDFVSFENILHPGGADVLDAPLKRLQQEQESIRRQSRQMLDNAKDEVTRIEAAAYNKGYEAGVKIGEQEGREKFTAAVQKVEELLVSLQNQRNEIALSYEKDLLLLIRAMVTKLVNHEVSVNPLVIKACLRRAMAFVVGQSVVKVRLNSEDFQRIKEAGLEDPELLEGKSKVHLVEDPAVALGGCLIESEFGEIDATVENFQARLFQAVENAFLSSLATSDAVHDESALPAAGEDPDSSAETPTAKDS